MNTQKYFKMIEEGVKGVYEVAEEARAKGLDPVDKVEIPLAMSMAEKVVGLISTIYPQMEESSIAKRILGLEKEYGKLDVAVAFKIAEEVAKQKFCKFKDLLEAIDAGVRVGFAYLTLGVVSSPIEGYTGLKLRKTRQGKDYFVAGFSGPIRSAGTTASCMVLILIDYLREMFGYEKHDPSEEEIKRVFTELSDFHDRITNLQYMPTEEETLFLAKNLPIQVSGDPSEKLEVSNYKNLERVETNYLRSGFCLILGEGLAQKAAKGFRLLTSLKKRGFKSTGFDFLEEYIKIHEKRDVGKALDSPTYIKDLVAGRPVFGHPSRSGAFRFRYGRGRVSGFSAASVHPATMAITDSFLAIGSQLKIEKPTKGAAITVCDQIDGPIVKLFNGSVKKLKSIEEAKLFYPDVEEIIYLGDILFPFSDVANRNADLIKPGYVEEWWGLELQEKDKEFSRNLNFFNIDFDTAVKISREFEISLHPNYIFYWKEISPLEFFNLIEWLKVSKIDGKIIFPYAKIDQENFKQGKRALELLGIEHVVTIENVVLNKEHSKALLANLGLDFELVCNKKNLLRDFMDENKFKSGKNILEIVNSVSEFEIRDKSGEFIGARMGRPEKAKLRKLVGSPNVLFPVGKEGGRLRSIQAACEQGSVRSAFPIYNCDKCKKETIYSVCEICGCKTRKMYYCPRCKEKSFVACEEHEYKQTYCTFSLDINHFFNEAVGNLGLSKTEIPLLIKGVRGTSSEGHMMENLSKGILRARNELQVNKDGTIRFDATELPLVAFKPREIGVDVEKLRDLGYVKDIDGKDIVNEEQIIELMPHDILLPSSPDTPDEKADDVFIRVANFVDEELVRFYKLKPFYNVKNRDDLIGKMGVCMAPHNCAGVICRFIGFSKTLGLLASPYMHAAIRRDCDGDEMAVMLLGDVLLNFSRQFLPSHRGGTQDAPLVLNAKIDAGEVDDQILDFEFVKSYPLELYRAAEQKKHSSEVKIKNVKSLLDKGENPFIGMGYTHDTFDFNKGIRCSSYKSLGTMQEKLKHQMELVEKIRAVDTSDTARLVIERHFMKDLRGNLRKFSTQEFRCVACNEILRRPPLTGICPKCGGKIIFTVHEGGIKKYLEPALNLAKQYNLSPYVKQNLELVKGYIDSIFGKEAEKQTGLGEWV
ncbi:MAG: DNA polymerase II large subunit [Nanoarchaeota archaeon]|nr:DNA polymerase II large subunit [Nanoarchaeota archaeon]MBU1027999.1 DNA polymerase II large subunit [Nanoarchaeota archaeon]